MKIASYLIALVLSLLITYSTRAQSISFDVTITADNQYGLYTGTHSQALNYVGGEFALSASQIWSPETYSMTLPSTHYIYISSWSDHATYQGLMAQFDNGTGLILSGDPQWEVTATGVTRVNGAPEVPLADLSDEIAFANAGSNPSGGWGAVYAGYYNNTSSLWGTAIGGGMSPSASWVWYDSGMHTNPNAPFIGFDHDEYLIFRIPINSTPIGYDPDNPDVPQVPEPASLLLLGLGASALLARRRRAR